MLKIGVLGVGHLGSIHMKCIQMIDTLELVGCYDIDLEKGKKVAAAHGVKAFEDEASLIAAVDIVDVVTPTVSHFELAQKAIESGRHVFIEKPLSKSSFLKILGTGMIGAAVIPPFLQSCGNNPSTLDTSAVTDEFLNNLKNIPLTSISQSGIDDVVLSEGLISEVLISYGDQISKNDTFGFNNDFLCYIPLDEKNPDDGLLWVNHEYADGLFVSGFKPGTPMEEKTKEEVDVERYNVGGSIVRIKKDKENGGKWALVPNDPYNRRLNSFTEIPFNFNSEVIAFTFSVIASNCSSVLYIGIMAT